MMTTTTQTIQDFYAILNTNPDDWETRLVLADAYEEMPFVTGSDCVVRRGSVYAEGQRWQVSEKQHANFSKEGGDWYFARPEKKERRWLIKMRLPFEFGASFSRPDKESHEVTRLNYYHGPTQLEADMWLAEQLSQCKEKEKA